MDDHSVVVHRFRYQGNVPRLPLAYRRVSDLGHAFRHPKRLAGSGWLCVGPTPTLRYPLGRLLS